MAQRSSLNVRDLPVDFRKTVCLQEGVGFRKMPAPEKPSACRERAGVRRSQDQMFGVIEEHPFRFGVVAPKEVDHRSVFFV